MEEYFIFSSTQFNTHVANGWTICDISHSLYKNNQRWNFIEFPHKQQNNRGTHSFNVALIMWEYLLSPSSSETSTNVK